VERDTPVERLPSETRLGRLVLHVRSLAMMRDFYRDAIGLSEIGAREGVAQMGTDAGLVLELRERPQAPPRPPRTSGLFHLALLEPDRAALAGSLRRLLSAGARLAGASDHLVSEALYLTDPEGNGIEIYRDRPADQWHWIAGEVEMATLPLNLESLLADDDDRGARSQATLGHVHFNVSDLEVGRSFYSELVGFDVTAAGYPGALFVSAGGYHHHIGMNTWSGNGIPAPPAGALGIAELTVVLPDAGSIDSLQHRLGEAGVHATRDRGSLLVEDPFGIALRFADGDDLD